MASNYQGPVKRVAFGDLECACLDVLRTVNAARGRTVFPEILTRSFFAEEASQKAAAASGFTLDIRLGATSNKAARAMQSGRINNHRRPSMHETNQPQIKSEKLGRDASVQIRGEDTPKVTPENTKWKAITRGIEIEMGINEFEWSAHYAAVAKLALLLEHLTSTDKSNREYAKKQVRELVKLGKEQ